MFLRVCPILSPSSFEGWQCIQYVSSVWGLLTWHDAFDSIRFFNVEKQSVRVGHSPQKALLINIQFWDVFAGLLNSVAFFIRRMAVYTGMRQFLFRVTYLTWHDSFISCWKSKKDVCRPFTSEGFAYQHSILRCFCGFNRNFVAFFMIRGFQSLKLKSEAHACIPMHAPQTETLKREWPVVFQFGADFIKSDFRQILKIRVFTNLSHIEHPWHLLANSNEPRSIVYFLSNNERTSVTSSREKQTKLSIFFPTMKEHPWHLLANSKRTRVYFLFSFQQWKKIR